MKNYCHKDSILVVQYLDSEAVCEIKHWSRRISLLALAMLHDDQQDVVTRVP